jgi:hypothetical protein
MYIEPRLTGILLVRPVSFSPGTLVSETQTTFGFFGLIQEGCCSGVYITEASRYHRYVPSQNPGYLSS